MRARFKRSLYRYTRASVDEAIAYLETKHAHVKRKIAAENRRLQAEIKRIRQQIEWMKSAADPSLYDADDVDMNAVSSSFAFLNMPDAALSLKRTCFGLNRNMVHRYLRKLQDIQREEIERLRQELEKRMQEHDRLLYERSVLKRSLKREVAAASEGPVEKPKERDAVPEESDPPAPNSVSDREAPLRQYKEWMRNMVEEIKASLTTFVEQLKEQQMREFIANERKVETETKDGQEDRPTEERMSKVVSMQERSGQRKVSVMPVPKERENRQALKRHAAIGMGFWDEDLDRYLASSVDPLDLIHSYEEGTEEAVAQRRPPVNKSERYEAEGAESAAEGSPAITEEAWQLRKKYVVGKAAGSDLQDDAGRWIVRKGEIITEEIMNRAEREGKLAELIVHMIVPGLGE